MNALACLAVMLGSLVQDGQPLTIDQAVEIALTNGFGLRTSAARVEKARQQESEARGSLGPKLTLGASYSRFEGAVTSGQGQVSSNSPGVSPLAAGSSASAPNSSKQASVSLTQVFDISGTIHRSVEAARFGTLSAVEAFGAEENAVRQQVKGAFYNVLLAKALVKVQTDAKDAAQARLDKATVRQREGAVPMFDVLRFQNDLRKTEQQLVQALGSLESAKQALNNVLARPIETAFEPVDVVGLPGLPDSPEPLVESALQSRQEIKQSALTVKSLGKFAESQERGTRPSLVLSAAHNRVIDPPMGSSDNGTIGTLALSYPVFDSGITRSRVRAARQDENSAVIGLEQTTLAVVLDVRSAYTRLTTAKESLAVALDSERLATEALRLAQLRYDEGAGILIDVTAAQADLTAARGSVQSAKYEYLTAYSSLQRAVGRDDLGQGVRP
ncbi:MAG: TolC family protein [Fimbriimonadaceae bacterium]|nr:TolC family protein [Fimbriimonadaceae bacterium]QYK59618.1 MAG: TolC family protein [Fimbriimonadaceae bacterium]